MIRLILFDFDGTIADSFENFLRIIDVMSSKYGLPQISPEEIPELRKESARNLIKKLKVPIYKIPFIARDMKKLQRDQISTLKPFKEFPNILMELKSKNIKLGIATSNGKANVELFLKNNNLELFDYMYCDIGMFGKSSVIKKILKEHKLGTTEVLYVGDEIRDIEASHKAGIKIAAATWGFNSKEGLMKHAPDYLINKPSELLALLKSKN